MNERLIEHWLLEELRAEGQVVKTEAGSYVFRGQTQDFEVSVKVKKIRKRPPAPLPRVIR